MGKVGRDLSKVDVGAGRRPCSKPKCAHRRVARHHIRHQFMFVSAFVQTRYRDPAYKKFVERYYAFHPDDVRLLCSRHHLEIHRMYDRIIRRDILRLGKSLRHYTWREAEKLMDKLEKRCLKWLETETPGAVGKRRRVSGGFQNAVHKLKKEWIEE